MADAGRAAQPARRTARIAPSLGALARRAARNAHRWRAAATTAGGKGLAAATRILALRPARKPLHPTGKLLRGRVRRCGSATAAGVSWLDDVGEDVVLVRLSRAIGLPRTLPDIHGLAMRVRVADGVADLLLASTGWGRLGRHVLRFGWRPESGPLTTLLPYRAASGPVVLGARALGPGRYSLWWSHAGGPWSRFGTLELSGEVAGDISFDPVLNQLPGLAQYPLVVRLREPSYARARLSRR
jgi:hypothetical protein